MTVSDMKIAKQSQKVNRLKGELASGLMGEAYKRKIREYLKEKEQLHKLKQEART